MGKAPVLCLTVLSDLHAWFFEVRLRFRHPDYSHTSVAGSLEGSWGRSAPLVVKGRCQRSATPCCRSETNGCHFNHPPRHRRHRRHQEDDDPPFKLFGSYTRPSGRDSSRRSEMLPQVSGLYPVREGRILLGQAVFVPPEIASRQHHSTTQTMHKRRRQDPVGYTILSSIVRPSD